MLGSQPAAPIDPTEASFRQVGDSMPNPAWMARPDGVVDWYNRAWLEFVGKTPEEMELAGWEAVHDPRTFQQVSEQWRHAVATETPFELEYTIRRHDGVYRRFLTRAQPIRNADGRVIRWFGTKADVTDRYDASRKIEALNLELSRRVEELEKLLDTLPVGVFIAHDPLCRWMTTNPAGARMLWMDAATNPSKTGAEADRLPFRVLKDGVEVPPDQLPMQRAATTNRTIDGEVFEVHHNSGEVRKLFEYAVPLRSNDGDVRGCLGVFIDLTTQLEATAARAESENRFRMMADSAAVLIWMTDDTGALTWFNRPWLEFVGRPLETQVGRGWAESVHPDDRNRVVGTLEEHVAARREFQLSFRLRQSGGQWRFILGNGVPLHRPDGVFVGFVGSCTDVTDLEHARSVLQDHATHLEREVAERTEELARTHERVRVSERLAALGTLAAGIGHDLGNLLLPVRVRAQALADLAGPAAAVDHAAIVGSLDYLGRLSSGLRLLTMDGTNRDRSSGETDLAEWWRDTSGLLKNLLPSNVVLASRVAPERVAINPPSLTQAVFNLVQNAGDAMRASGVGSRVTVWCEPAGDLIRVGVSDDGPGMSPEVRDRCLDAFFTTKPRGISTGLGLVLVRGLVQRCGGTLDVISSPGEGSSFIMSLPRAAGAALRNRQELSAAVSLRDARVRSFVLTQLEQAGVAARRGPAQGRDRLLIIDAGNGDEVLAFVNGHPDRRAIVFGEKTPSSDPRMRTLDGAFRVTDIRDCLADVVASLRRSGSDA